MTKAPKITVLQVDNRPDVKFIRMIASINQVLCQKLGYDYSFLFMQEAMVKKFSKPNQPKYLSAHCAKIGVMGEFLNTSNYDIVIFLDSDAWIENPNHLAQLVDELKRVNKQGCFSRDPYRWSYTYINSGSFILKINDYTRNMYKEISHNYFHEGKRLFPDIPNCWDQYYISEWIYENREDFYIFAPEVINTPSGKVIRHDWRKEKKLVETDLSNRFKQIIKQPINNKDKFDFSKFIDSKEYPNPRG